MKTRSWTDGVIYIHIGIIHEPFTSATTIDNDATNISYRCIAKGCVLNSSPMNVRKIDDLIPP